jgi:hypothetical protein
MNKRQIEPADIMPMAAYGAERAERRRKIAELKRNRRVAVGPDATAYFENYDTMWHQVHEMLFIEKGGDEQLQDELRAYNPLIPKGNELVCTLMFEIDDPVRRARVLGALGGVEETVFLEVAGERVRAVAEADVDRTTAEGKASSVQFLHFQFTPEQAAKFRASGARVLLGIEHQAYAHMTVLPEAVRTALAADLA